jgi:hypothetical protein
MSYVYVLTAEHAEQVYFKIGYSKNSGESRVGSLKTGCPIPLLSLVDFELEDNAAARKVERILHRIYATSGSSGEWFHLNTYRELLKLPGADSLLAAYELHDEVLSNIELISEVSPASSQHLFIESKSQPWSESISSLPLTSCEQAKFRSEEPYEDI